MSAANSGVGAPRGSCREAAANFYRPPRDGSALELNLWADLFALELGINKARGLNCGTGSYVSDTRGDIAVQCFIVFDLSNRQCPIPILGLLRYNVN